MDDLIYRQDAIKAVGYYHCHSGDKLLFADNALKELPSSQKWILCSERLPTKTGHYLCSFKKPNRIDRIYVDLAYWTGGRWYGYMGDEINAWMPLPSPYKENSNETD